MIEIYYLTTFLLHMAITLIYYLPCELFMYKPKHKIAEAIALGCLLTSGIGSVVNTFVIIGIFIYNN